MIKTLIKKIYLKNQDEIDVQNDTIIVFVGPNNVGKSQVLKELHINLQANLSPKILIEKIDIIKEGSAEDFFSYIKSCGVTKIRPINNEEIITLNGLNTGKQSIISEWSKQNHGFDNFHWFMSQYLKTDDRLMHAFDKENIDIVNDAPKDLLHFLQRDDELKEKISSFFKSAFGIDLILNSDAGRVIRLHVGESPELEDNETLKSHTYLTKISNLPKLSEQGDGMKSFYASLVHLFVPKHSITLIDEPEAFLHPAQAIYLGKIIDKNFSKSRQLFIATHSEDFLKGLLDNHCKKIKVIRITRDENTNKFQVLNNEDIIDLWSNSFLKHSNVLSGLFHEKVIICESDADCRFYSAILDSYLEQENLEDQEVLFINAGGKHRIPSIIDSLSKLGIEIYAITDFDVIRETDNFKNILQALGGDWDLTKEGLHAIQNSIRNKKPSLERNNLKIKINEIIDNKSDDNMNPDELKEIKEILKKSSAWEEAKRIGRSYIPPAELTNKFNEIITITKRIGFYIVESGELESFDRTVSGHGPKWVANVLEKDLKNESFNKARNFIKGILD